MVYTMMKVHYTEGKLDRMVCRVVQFEGINQKKECRKKGSLSINLISHQRKNFRLDT